jgi:hypothetical protein
MSNSVACTLYRGIALGAALVIQTACSTDHSTRAPSAVSFNGMFDQTHVVPLASPLGHSLGPTSDALVTDSEIALLDGPSSDLKVFSRRDGSLARIVGRAGSDSGDFRNPAAIAPFDSGRYVVYDQRRRVISLRDSLGQLISESPSLRGSFTGLIALPEQHRVVLTGHTFNQNGDTRDVDLHEYDFNGKRLASYAATAKSTSEVEANFGTLVATRIGSDIVTGSLSSNRLRLYDRATKHEKWVAIAPDWYRPLEFPAHVAAVQKSPANSAMSWMHTQPFLNGVFALGGGRLLVRFQAFTSLQDKAFYYAVADTSGRTLAISQATRARVVATRADTVFWIKDFGTRGASLTSGVVDVTRLASGASSAATSNVIAAR